jgi:hypothetical protein
VGTAAIWLQQGGNGRIESGGYNSEGDYTDWYFRDVADSDPSVTYYGTQSDDRPWKPANTGIVTITPVPETVTVDRTASVIDSDRKGESRPLLSKVVGGAAVAYSLRDLNDRAGNNKVVRVRRASDNHERDFLAKEVSNGTLKNWVNTQTVLPLDIQALEADGRTGDFLIAKAAYSLRSLGTRQATVAATGDTVARADGKYVVQVRRSSDDALKSFTADEVTDGTLLNFVKTEAVTYTSDFSTDTDGWSAGNGSAAVSGGALELTPNTASTTHHVTESGLVGAGEKVRVSFDVKIPSGQSLVNGFKFVEVSGATIKQVNNQAQGDFVSYSEEFTSTSTGTLRFFANKDGNITFAGDDSEKIIIKNIVITSIDENGFVKTWYDQSVTNQAGDTATGNHAVQATTASQPKIVNAGALVADSGIDFDGSQFLQANSVSGMGATVSMNVASVHDSGGGGCVSLASSASGVTNFGIIEGNSVTNVNSRNTTSVTASASVSGVTRLGFALTTGQTSTKSGALGGTLVESTSDYGDDFTSGELDRIIIGKLRVSSGTLFDGRVREALIYDSDQTDNRTAIEANIGEAYSITGIPAYDNTVDGFVETWYDQSGNDNDAVQITSTEQPKIVSAGSLMLNDDGHTAIGFQRLSSGSTYFDLTTGIDIANSHSFQYVEFNKTYTYTLVETDGGGSNRIGYLTGSQLRLYRGGSLNFGAGISVTNNPFIYTTFLAADGSASKVNVNGDEVLNQVLGNGTGGTTFNAIFRGDNSGLDSQFTKLSELIVYDTDQSANRPAIEANINNQYDIY